MKVKIISWNAIAAWNWDLGDNNDCTICMTSFESPCPNCKTPGDECPPLEGSCGHFFHLHCIYRWLATSDKCPLDRELWSEKIVSIINNNTINSASNSNANINLSL